MTRTSSGAPRALVLAASLALVTAGRPALAQSTSEKAAQTAFDDGMKLLGQGKTAEACPKLEETQQQARSGVIDVTIPMLAPSTDAVAREEKSPPASESPAEPASLQRSLVPGLVLGSAALAGIGAGIALVVVATGKKAEQATLQAREAGEGSGAAAGPVKDGTPS